MTGDVHHSSLKSDDLSFCKGSEIDAAISTAEIASDFNIPITLFFTGKCAEESPKKLEKIANIKNVDIGGHNYFAFNPRILFDGYYYLTGLKNGPYIYQWVEVGKTKKALQKVCKIKLMSWRDHAYRHDKNTRKILKSHEIQYFSDVLSNNRGQPQRNGGIIDVPINILPDHDYVFHGSRTPDTINPEILLKTQFATPPMYKEAWLKKIKKEIKYIISENGVATILTHPACMEVFDEYETFKKLCNFLKNY